MNDATTGATASGPQVEEAVILLRSASHTPGGEPYAAAVTEQGKWLRLSPLSFRIPGEARQLRRWNRVRFLGQLPVGDARPESREVLPATMEIIGILEPPERAGLIASLLRVGLGGAGEASLALLAPEKPQFSVHKKTPEELAAEQAALEAAAPPARAPSAKPSRFKPPPPPKAFGYRFSYRFICDGREQDFLYQDAEMSAMFGNLARSFGEPMTVSKAMQLYGREYPAQGMMCVASRADLRGAPWVIHGIIGRHETESTAGALDMVV